VKVKITDAAGRDVREISGQVLANSNKPGYQAACWDLRVQPGPAPAAAAGRGGAAAGAGQAAGGGAGAAAPGGRAGGPGGPAASPFGAGCTAGGRGGGGGFGGAGGGNAGPFVLPGTYNIALVVDGKTVETKPLKVTADADVALTAIERAKLFNMAMEMHELQRVGTEVSNALTPFNTRMQELAKEIAGKSDLSASVKTEFESLNKALTALVPKFAAGGGGRGGGGGGGGAPGGAGAAPPSPMARLTQAKNSLMGGMWPTEQTLKAYNDAKTQVPQAIAEANALFTRAAGLAKTLAPFDMTLTAPQPVKFTAPPAAKK
jgi:hypothetical protein